MKNARKDVRHHVEQNRYFNQINCLKDNFAVEYLYMAYMTHTLQYATKLCHLYSNQGAQISLLSWVRQQDLCDVCLLAAHDFSTSTFNISVVWSPIRFCSSRADKVINQRCGCLLRTLSYSQSRCCCVYPKVLTNYRRETFCIGSFGSIFSSFAFSTPAFLTVLHLHLQNRCQLGRLISQIPIPRINRPNII